jgi:hypothetical protein
MLDGGKAPQVVTQGHHTNEMAGIEGWLPVTH